jgi:hypothetical protein
MTYNEQIDLLCAQYSIISENEAYLKATDYQVIRQTEGGTPMSDEVKEKRAMARIAINDAQIEIETIKGTEIEVPEMPETIEIEK